MARQPLTGIAGCSLLASVLVAGACRKDPPYEGVFAIPVAAGVLQPEGGSPWSEPVAYVANARGGRIVPLLLQQGVFLHDDPFASFLPATPLPTGGARALGAVAAWASPECADARQPGAGADLDCRVSVFAGDAAWATLVEVQHVLRIEDGFPVEGWSDADGEHAAPTFDRGDDDDDVADDADVRFVDADANGNEPHLLSVAVRYGATATESWVVEWDGVDSWIVTGSRSGRQGDRLFPGDTFRADEDQLTFWIDGAGTCGPDPDGVRVCDRFELETRAGTVEHDVGGIPLALSTAPDRSRVAMIVHDRDADRPVLRFWDPATSTLGATIDLGADTAPNRFTWSEDGARLLVADRSRAAIWSVDTAAGDAVTEIPLPWPALDVAHLGGPEEAFFVLQSDGRTVWKVDAATGLAVDVNPHLAGDQGMVFDAPVNGIEAIPVEHLYVSTDDAGVRRSGRSVAIALSNSRTVFMEEESGCLQPDIYGPRTVVTGSFTTAGDYTSNFEDVVGGPFLQVNDLNDRHVLVSSCAGIAYPENWTLRFDAVAQAWQVEGNISGVQERMAIEDERYISDDGSVSFVLRAGAVASRPGWSLTFSVLDGVAAATGDADADGLPEWLMANPADPVFFSYVVGPAVGGWREYDERGFVLGLGTGSDRVGRVDPQEADVDIIWE